jgi:glyceraldehyde-3-phosphate dehydrogenase/erythrose-4-phosphate dehydrogenase
LTFSLKVDVKVEVKTMLNERMGIEDMIKLTAKDYLKEINSNILSSEIKLLLSYTEKDFVVKHFLKISEGKIADAGIYKFVENIVLPHHWLDDEPLD